MDSEYNFARKNFMASTKQCKCATKSTAAHIRFVADLDHHVPVKEGSAAARAAADDNSASACNSVHIKVHGEELLFILIRQRRPIATARSRELEVIGEA
jgi:hypothetical protein